MIQNTILIVDENAESRYMLERLLASRGHQIMAAQNGQEALQSARLNMPDVIISDIMMPVMNGFKLCCEVKKDPGLRHIPFIFYAATFVEKTDEKLAMTLGASRFVVKPTEGEAFLEILDDVLKEHGNGSLPVPEGPLEGEDILLEMYENRMTRKLAETVERLRNERKALTQSEGRLKRAQELAHIGHRELDLKTDSLEWSDEIYRILGLKPREIDPSSEAFIAAVHPDDRVHVATAHRESLSKRTPDDIEYRLVLRDGTVKYVHERCQTLYDDHGVPTCSMGTVQDITGRKGAEEKAKRKSEERYKSLFEEALRESESRYRIVADNTFDWEFWISPDGQFLYTSPSCERVTGHTADEFAHKPSLLHDIIHPQDREHYMRHCQRLMGEPMSGEIEFRIVCPDGSVRNIDHVCQPVFDDQGRYLGRRGSNRDITERKQAMNTLRESEERFRDLYENAPNAYFSIGADGLIRRCNRRAGELLGYEAEDLVGRPVSEIYAVTKYGKEKAAQVLEQFRAGKAIRDEELEMRKADGTPVWISLTVDAVQDPEDHVIESRSMVIDITARKRVESIMQARLRLLELANSCSMDELLTATLDEIEALTGSTIGFYHFLDPDQRTLSLQSWSTNTLKNMCAAEGKGSHYDVARAGVWVDCIHKRGPVIHNDYGSLPHRKGMPEGHAPVNREVVAPIFRGNLIMAIIGVGNKSGDYGGSDIEIVSQLGDLSWDIVERMQAEEALKKAEEKYRGIFENSLEGIFQSTPEGHYLSVNPALARMLGYDSPQDLIASGIDIGRQLYVNPEDRTRFEQSLEEHESVKEFVTEEYRMDGSRIWVSINARAVRGSDGAILYYEGTVEDISEHRRLAVALRDSELRYRAIVEAFDGLIYVCSEDYRVEFMNDKLIRRTGYDATGELCYKTLHERDSICPWCVNERVFKGETVRWEVKSPKDDHWYYIVNTPIYHPDGRMSKQAMIMDITERKGAEEALRESEERYRTIFQNSPLGIFRTTVDGRFLEANPAAAKLFGYNSTETLIREVHDIGKQLFAHPEDRPRIISEQIGSPGVTRRVTRYRCKDGSELIANLYLQTIRSAEGQPLFFEGIVEDITERVRAEEALRRANETLRATLEAAPLAIFDLDMEGRVKSLWNVAAEQMLGWGRDEVIGHFLPSVQEDKKEEFTRFRDWIRSGKRMMGHDVVRRRKDGSLIEYSIYAAPEYDNDGKVAGNIAVLVDITDRKRAEAEIRKLNMELEQRVKDRTASLEAANKELEAFAYSVSHDLRAPLRHIDGFLELLQKSSAGALDERGKHYMSTISEAARRMGTLIDDLLSFSRMGRFEMSKGQVDLGDLVEQVIRELGPETEGRTIRWRIGDLPVVTGDRAMLRIVLVNLISNALKFTRPREQAEIEIGCTGDREIETVVFVRDNGVGFDMAYVDKLFNVFQRLHRADEFEGTGIGLANVRRIINRHGGRAWAEGAVDGGATFYFSLPNTIQGEQR